jgi:cobalt-zinc-cadmium efflux system protein
VKHNRAPTRREHIHSPREEGILDRNLVLSILLNALIVVAEIIGGVLSGSLALLSDALHNLSDVAALTMAWMARRFGKRPASLRHTYGLKRLEVLAALLNSAILLVFSTLIVRESIIRLFHPGTVQGTLMMVVAGIGLLANLFSVLLLRSHAHDDLNMRSAFLHLAQDTISSVLVIIAALFSGWRYGAYLDPIASLLVIAIIMRSGWKLLRETAHILMEGTPTGLDLELLQQDLHDRFPIRNLHHLHVWEVNSGRRMLTAHLVFDDKPLSEVEGSLTAIRDHLRKQWAIEHATLEPEINGCTDRSLIKR